MPAPALTTAYAEQLAARLEPWMGHDPDGGWPLATLIRAAGVAWREVDDVALYDDDGRSGWSRLLDPTLCPDWALPYLAAHVGVRLPVVESTAVWRQRIRDLEHLRRGTPGYLAAFTRRYLTGSRSVTVVQRSGGNRWRIGVIVRTAECADPTGLQALLNAPSVVPAGHKITVTATAGQAWDEVPAGVTWDDAAAGLSWDEVPDTPLS